MAGGEDDHEHRQQLLLAQAPAFVAGGEEGADEVGLGVGGELRPHHPPALGDEVGEVGPEGLGTGLAAAAALLVTGHDQQGVRPLLEVGPVLGRHADELADHRDRQRDRQPLDEVDHAGPVAAVAVDGVEQAVGDLLGPAPQPVHPPGSEGLPDQAAQAGVVGRVGGQQAAHLALLLAPEGRLEPAQRLRHRLGRLDEAGVAEDEAHLVVAGDDPRLETLLADPVDGRRLPQLLEEQIGVGPDFVGIQIQRHRLGHGHHCGRSASPPGSEVCLTGQVSG